MIRTHEDIRQLFRIVRRKTGMSLEDFARQMGISKRTLMRIQTGDVQIRKPHLHSLYYIHREFCRSTRMTEYLDTVNDIMDVIKVVGQNKDGT